ncbi:MAG: toll/interleukin-1 receptor domain-containing protein [Acidobacteriota bacterium]|nr:toll/interleukin-1 receptor domain-containing protein [Acidobacteriota bacterium]
MRVEELALQICRTLESWPSVEIPGLGTFERNSHGVISFREKKQPTIFIAYAVEDVEVVERLYGDLETRGYSPWMDRKKLLPGQNWPRRIHDAIESADFFIACFSTTSAGKRGAFQAEIRYALDSASKIPLDEVFLIPVRLDECRVPLRIERETQYVDLFPVWEMGMARIVRIIEKQRRIAA